MTNQWKDELESKFGLSFDPSRPFFTNIWRTITRAGPFFKVGVRVLLHQVSLPPLREQSGANAAPAKRWRGITKPWPVITRHSRHVILLGCVKAFAVEVLIGGLNRSCDDAYTDELVSVIRVSWTIASYG
jgi:hypothetical protein